RARHARDLPPGDAMGPRVRALPRPARRARRPRPQRHAARVLRGPERRLRKGFRGRDPAARALRARRLDRALRRGVGDQRARARRSRRRTRAGRRRAAVPPRGRARRRRARRGGPTALFVGRLAPNKGHRRALRVAAAYAELFGEPLRLRFVGFHDPRWARWIAVLGRERESLGLGSTVDFVGSLTEAELKSAYLTSHVFLCCSEHEGFCVPLVEASELGLPVVAAYQDAVADTLGPSGLVLREASDDALAVAVRRVLRDPELRDAV